MPQGLPRRIRYAFVTQGVLASLTVLVGVTVVFWFARDALIRQRLQVESEAFWQRNSEPARAVQLPHTDTIRGWFTAPGTSGGDVPPAFRALPAGITRLPGHQGGLLVERRPAGALYLQVSTPHVDRILLQSAMALMLLGLLAVGGISWLTYRKSRDIVLPVNRLAEEVARWDPIQGDLSTTLALPSDGSREVMALSSALQGLSGRIGEFVQRERDFTRDASHELRTPLTVIRVATDMLIVDPATAPHSLRSLQRIQRAGRDMESVIDAFLILARERGVAPVSEDFAVRDVVAEEVDKARALLAGRPVELELIEEAQPHLYAPPGVLSVMVRNLLENACTFTEAGRVEVVIRRDAIVVRDTGIGMSDETLRRAFDPFFRADEFKPLGKGFGLSIVSRLGNRFGWPLTLDSVPGRGTTATIRFA